MKLPIERVREEIIDKIINFNQLIIRAEPGSGKTTRVPLYASEATTGRVLVLEPRRIAARLSAEFVAKELGEVLGEKVGYRVRFDSKATDQTTITFITEGLFLRILANDPELLQFKAIIIDEFHERSLNTDIALAIIGQLQQRRPDLKLIIMSATMDVVDLQKWLPQSVLVDVKGHVYPVTIDYQPPEGTESQSRQVVRAVSRHYRSGNVLVFLSSTAEILKLKRELENLLPSFETIPLTSKLAFQSLPKIYSGDHKKIILATNVAETSLTLPGITFVIDSGWHLAARLAPWSGLDIVERKKIAKDAAIQRGGRAGRVEPGICIRLYDPQDFEFRSDFTLPEIRRIDLSQMILDLLSTKYLTLSSNGYTFHFKWFEDPSSNLIALGLSTLKSLNAIDDFGITKFGQAMTKFPIHPRLSAILIAGKARGFFNFSALTAAYISENGPDTTDLVSEVMELARHRKFSGNLAAVELLYRQLSENSGEISLPDQETATELILAGFSDRVGKILPRGAEQLPSGKFRLEYAFSGRRSGILESPQHPSELLIVTSATEINVSNARKTLINIATPVSKESLKAMKEFRVEIVKHWKADKSEYQEIEQYWYDSLLIEEKFLGVVKDSSSVQSSIRKLWPQSFPDPETLVRYHSIISLLNRYNFSHSFPRLEGEFLELIFSCLADEFDDVRVLKKKSIHSILQEHLGVSLWNFYTSEFPSTLKIPSGREVVIHYEPDRDPWIEGKLPEFYSTTRPITIGSIKIPVTVQLLSPAGRPLQVTADLPRFWAGSYKQIQKEMKSRYPKHFWPDDPANSPATLPSRRR
jgi:ATP-dependent helicase HrpB